MLFGTIIELPPPQLIQSCGLGYNDYFLHCSSFEELYIQGVIKQWPSVLVHILSFYIGYDNKVKISASKIIEGPDFCICKVVLHGLVHGFMVSKRILDKKALRPEGGHNCTCFSIGCQVIKEVADIIYYLGGLFLIDEGLLLLRFL